MTEQVELKPLRHRDIRRCVEIEKVLFHGDSPWNASAFRAELDSGAYYLGAFTMAGLVGYAGLAVVGRPGEFEASLHTIGVDTRHQGIGIGTLLLEAILDRADELRAPVFLEVRTDNAVALALYEKYGFSRLGLRRRYYQPSGADAYTMGRPPVAVTEEAVR